MSNVILLVRSYEWLSSHEPLLPCTLAKSSLVGPVFWSSVRSSRLSKRQVMAKRRSLSSQVLASLLLRDNS